MLRVIYLNIVTIYCLFDKLDGEHELKAFLAKLKLSASDLLIDFMINVLDNDDSDNILKKLKEVLEAIDLKEERDLSIKIIDKSLSDGKFGIIDKLWLVSHGGFTRVSRFLYLYT